MAALQEEISFVEEKAKKIGEQEAQERENEKEVFTAQVKKKVGELHQGHQAQMTRLVEEANARRDSATTQAKMEVEANASLRHDEQVRKH